MQSKVLPDEKFCVEIGRQSVYDRGEVNSMEKRGLPQEALKAIACVTMLLDHIGAMFMRGETLRIIGRIAFPIFCFLMAEGAYYTRNPRRYALRLIIGMLLSELPFDYAFRFGPTWGSQSVMVTLLIGFIAVEAIQSTSVGILKLLITAAGFALADYANTDYGGYGVLLVILFSQTRGQWWFQTVLVAMFAWMTPSLWISVLGLRIPIEMFAVLAMIPIGLYSGRKLTTSKVAQWAFYLFYPLHLTVLVLIRLMMEKGIL